MRRTGLAGRQQIARTLFPRPTAGTARQREAAAPMEAPGRRPVRAWKWVVRMEANRASPVPGPVLFQAPSSKPLIRLAFGAWSAQSAVQCPGAHAPPCQPPTSSLPRRRRGSYHHTCRPRPSPSSSGWLTASHARGLRGLRDARPFPCRLPASNRQVDGLFDAFGSCKADRRATLFSTPSSLDRISDRIDKVLVYLSTKAIRR